MAIENKIEARRAVIKNRIKEVLGQNLYIVKDSDLFFLLGCFYPDWSLGDVSEVIIELRKEIEK